MDTDGGQSQLLRRTSVVIGVHLWLALFSICGASAADLLIRNTRLIDGTGAAPRAGASILIRAGRIAEIGSTLVAPDVPAIDAAGATIVPGLIDAHVHNAVVPGSAFRNDAPEVLTRLRLRHLRGYLAAGVTTILDTGISVELARQIRQWLADGEPGPNVFVLGPPLAAPDGYGAARNPGTTVSAPEQLDAAFDLIQSAGAIGVKVFIETGFGPGEGTLPTHSPEMQAAISRAAAARGLPIYTHASSENEQRMGLAMGARALVHLDFYTQVPSADFLDEVQRSKSFVMTTFSIMDAALTRFDLGRLDDPLVVLAVPDVERATARDLEAGWLAAETEIGAVFPWLPSILRRPLAWAALRESTYRDFLASSMRAARILHDVGVPLVIGSDAGNWESVPYQFHASSTHREIELLAEAGVAPADVLAAATRVPARMMGIDNDVGTIAVGKRADLVVIDGDPLRDVGVLRKIRWTVKDGVARTPAEWIRFGHEQ